MERLVNLRLLDFFLPGGDTVNTTMWRQCQTNNYRQVLVSGSHSTNSEQVVSLFFDMGKAYDLTRRHGILMDIHEAGMERRMFKFIKNFLKPRSFKVKANEILSDIKVQTEGIH